MIYLMQRQQQKKLVNKSYLNENIRKLATQEQIKKIATKTEFKAEQDKTVKLQKFDLSLFIGKHYFCQ